MTVQAKKHKGWTKIDNKLLSADDLKPTTKAILMMYIRHEQKCGYTYVSDKAVGRALNLSARSVSGYKRRLRDKGYLWDVKVIAWFRVLQYCPLKGGVGEETIQRSKKFYFTNPDKAQGVMEEAVEKMVRLMKKKLLAQNVEVLSTLSYHCHGPSFLCTNSQFATFVEAKSDSRQASNKKKPKINPNRNSMESKAQGKKKAFSVFSVMVKWVMEFRKNEIENWLLEVGLSPEGRGAVFSLSPELIIPRYENARRQWEAGAIESPGGVRRMLLDGWFKADA